MADSFRGTIITLPPLEQRPYGLFTDGAADISAQFKDGPADRITDGARFQGWPELSPIIVDFSCETEDDKSVGNLELGELAQVAFLSFNLFECSALSGTANLDETGEFVDRTFEATVSEALTRAATSAVSGSHINLAVNSTALAASASPGAAVGLLEDALGERISNLRGHIFVPLGHLGATIDAGAVSVRGAQLVSAAGHRVISDAGHEGDDVFYATGSLAYATSETITRSHFERAVNRVTWLKEHYGIVLFNPAHSVRTTLS